KIVPSHLSALLAGPEGAQALPRQRLLLGGEATSWELAGKVRELRPECRLLNHYGPTETTVGALTHRWRGREGEGGAGTLPLGRPLGNLRVYVLDSQQRPVAIGERGEIYLGGAGVTRGYLNEAAVTAGKYLP